MRVTHAPMREILTPSVPRNAHPIDIRHSHPFGTVVAHLVLTENALTLFFRFD